MLRDVLSWWLQQLAALLPRRLFGDSRFGDAVLVRPQAGALVASLRRRGVESLLGPLEPGSPALRRLRGKASVAVVLALPAAALLQQSTTLPLAAERELDAVLGHEMDRLTPFRAADVYWGWRLDARDRAAGRLRLRLLLVPKRAIAASLDRLTAAGLRPAALEIGSGGTVEHLPLQPPGATAGSRRSARAAGWVCAALAVALLAVPLLRQEWAIDRAQARVADLRPEVALVDALRRRVANNDTAANLFIAESARIGSPLRAIAAVTAALPDDTSLTSLSMRERRLSLSGLSAGAARLIAALSANPDLRDPAFDAPVTRVGDRSDLFSIRATLAP